MTETAVERIRSIMKDESMIKKVLEYYSVKSHGSNGSVRACCPIHHGNNPTAFVWNPSKGLWFCHTGCKRGGDVFDFVGVMENLSPDEHFKRIVYLTADILEIDISQLELGERTESNKREMLDWIKFMTSKIEKKEHIEFNLNSLGDLFPITEYRTFNSDTLSLFGVQYCRDNNRILLPIHSDKGIIVGATMRRINNQEKIKWLHKPDGLISGNYLFNMHRVNGTNVRITEGPFDVMNQYQNGIYNSVGAYGSHITDAQVELICKSFFEVELMFDGDNAGRLANIQGIEKLRHKVDLSIYDLPDGIDPGDLNLEDINNLDKMKPYQYLDKYKSLIKK